MASHDDRDRGILTATDREWLREQTDGSTPGTANQRDYQRRQAIQERVTNALRDFQLLTEELPESLLRDILVSLQHERAYSDSLSYGIAFLYTLANEREYLQEGITIGREPGAHRFLTFERALDDGLSTAREHTGWFGSPSSDGSPRSILHETPPLEEISIADMYTQWRDYAHWKDPETGEKLYESGEYPPSEAKSIAYANIIAGIGEIKSRKRSDKRSVPSEFRDLVDDTDDTTDE
ncbi:hypothetical protein [Halorubrum sp. CGM4_25_10-8A]|uniref:hypothetical protein n=1 Tax=Halorubrum sp. CGM4_25_10-8A TaxID=2518116 RepID=UPI0010F4DE25|nr:hypothetical protein [Halorubrum sp. CGM4_25_10-8A]TKX41358.1 hypothetical protein EXE52_04125 [Halorubrum sp. CGM4_25_10-8A]